MNAFIDDLFFPWLSAPLLGGAPQGPEFAGQLLQAALLTGGITVATGLSSSYLVYGGITRKGVVWGGSFPLVMLGSYALWRFPFLRHRLGQVLPF